MINISSFIPTFKLPLHIVQSNTRLCCISPNHTYIFPLEMNSDYDDYNATVISPDTEVTNPFSSSPRRNDNAGNSRRDPKDRGDFRRNDNNNRKDPRKKHAKAPIIPSIGIIDFLRDRRFHVALGIALILAATYLTVSAISYLSTAPEDQSEIIGSTVENIVSDPDSQITNIGGPAGAVSSHYLITLGLGIGAFPILIWMVLCGISLFGLRKCQFWSMTFKALLFAVTLSLSIGLVTHGLDMTIPLGGFHGRYVNTWLMERIGWIGAAFTSLLLIGFVVAIYFYDILKIYQAYRRRVETIKEHMREAREAREAERRKVEEAMKASELGEEEKKTDKSTAETAHFDPFDSTDEQAAAVKKEKQPEEKDISSEKTSAEDTTISGSEKIINDIPADIQQPTATLTVTPEPQADPVLPVNTPNPISTETERGSDVDSKPDVKPVEPVENVADKTESATEPILATEPEEDHKEPGFTVSTQEEIEQVEYGRIGSTYDPTAELSHFRMPVLDLLEDRPTRTDVVDITEISDKKNQIIYALDKLNIGVAHIDATVGPTVTMYEITPVEGVRIATIKRLEEDIAMALSAISTRIIAPIPGKSAIGIEVPNSEPQSVSIRTILGSRKYQECDYELPLAIGTTISNDVHIADLAKMPHLLVAGATGKGKSVGMNVIINSLIYKKHPAELKFVLIDPKRVEFYPYRKLEKHYLAKLPDEEDAIVTDMSKVIDTLKSLCVEMDNRYDLLMKAEVVQITHYNKLFTERKLNPEKGHRYLPYIVVIIDEYADLVMTVGKEAETPVARIAQKARAVGIHMIIATQRPSANIITGVIRANFPARMAFQVSSRIDSKIILENNGAASLIGKGDMLISHDSKLERVQCAFIDTPEIKAVSSYIGDQTGYPHPYLLPPTEVAGPQGGARGLSAGERDPLFNEIARDIVSSGVASTSGLQRRYSIGFARAGKIMDQLEAVGIVGPSVGGKMRDILVDTYRLEEILSGQ